MSKVIYITSMSLDGYVEDESGAFDWINPEQVHEFVTELVRPMETYLYGRRLYETMAYFGTQPVENYPPERREFARGHDINIGGGKAAFRTGLRRHLELLQVRRFDTGVVHLHYRVQGRSTS